MLTNKSHLDEFLQASVQARCHAGESCTVISQGMLVVVDEVQVVLWGDIIVATQLVQEAGTEGAHALVHQHHVLNNAAAYCSFQGLLLS